VRYVLLVVALVFIAGMGLLTALDIAHTGLNWLDVLAILNDRTADGRDVSWIWDADFELLATHVRRVTCAGTRAASQKLSKATDRLMAAAT